jgi:protocatechuate 3,4-dioxygenase beta subunit
MKRQRVCTIATVLFLTGIVSSHALNVSVAPSTLDWNINAWVDVTISNLTPGASVQLVLLVDADQNRALSPADRPLAGFTLADGQTNRFGAVYMPSDVDGLSNGVIQTRISYHGLDAPMHAIGSYLWVAYTNAAMPVSQSFAVLQDTSTVWITGTVRDYRPPNDPISAARVQMVYFSDARGGEPAVWTDTNGAFRIYLPPGIGTNDVRGVMAVGAGLMGADQTPDGEWLSAYPFEQPLTTGENALTNALYLVGLGPDILYAVSGRVVAVDGATTSPVPWALINAEVEGDDGPGVWSVDITRDDGSFTLVLPGGTEALLLMAPNVNQRGLSAELKTVMVGTQDVTGVEIHCYPAQAMARGRVVDADSGAPVPGLMMYWFDPDAGAYGFAYSLGNGFFEISSLKGSNYTSGSFEEYTVWRAGYVPPAEQGPYAIGIGEVFTNLLFELEPAHVVRGRVYDTQTNALQNGRVIALPTGAWDTVNSADVNLAGEYELRVPSGRYRLQTDTDGFPGYLPMVWSNHFMWEWSESGPACDPIEVAGDDVAGIDFYLPPAAYIRGTVLADGAPLSNVNVSAQIREGQGGVSRRGGAVTGPDGTYEIAVLGGTSYLVQAAAPGDTFWLPQYYSNAPNMEVATPVEAQVGTPATNIDFNLVKGGWLSGTLYGPGGLAPFTNAQAFVSALNFSNDWINSTVADPQHGIYHVVVPPGEYRVRAEAPGWLPQYYGGYFDYRWQLAPLVTVGVEQVVGELDITMAPPSIVEGMVMAGGAPLSNVNVELNYVQDTNSWTWQYVASALTDIDGHYSMNAPPGTNFAVRAAPSPSSGYQEQWWSNAPNVQAATLFDLHRTQTLSNINFDLLGGLLILGRVLNEIGAAVPGVAVEAWWGNPEQGWQWGGETYADSNGYYAMTLSADTGYVVKVRRSWPASFEDWWYPETFYSNSYWIDRATVLWTNAGHAISNVDITVYPGFQLTGRVVRVSGGDAITGAWLSVFCDSTTNWLAGALSDDAGVFRMCLPTNWPVYVQAQSSLYGQRWFSNVYGSASATPIVGTAYHRIGIELALSRYDEDADGDGYNEYDETQILFTDPTDANDYLRWAQAVRSVSGVEVRWDSSAGVAYWIERCENLRAGEWAPVAGPEIGTGGIMSVIDTNAVPHAVYRILVTGSGPD